MRVLVRSTASSTSMLYGVAIGGELGACQDVVLIQSAAALSTDHVLAAAAYGET